MQDTAAEIDKRRQLAASLAGLAAEFTALSKLTVSADVSTAATKLGNELIAIDALPEGLPAAAASPETLHAL